MGSTIQSDSHILFPQAKGSFNTIFDNFIKKKKIDFMVWPFPLVVPCPAIFGLRFLGLEMLAK